MGGGAAGFVALSALFAATAAVSQSKPPTSGPIDPLQAVVFAGQDAVIDLGPIVPTPQGPTPAASPSPRADPTPAGATRFTVTRLRADGTREIRAIDSGELQALGRAPPPPTIAARTRRPVRTVAAVAPSSSPPRSLVSLGWTPPAPAPETAVELAASDAADAVSPLLVTGRTVAPSRKKSRETPALGVRDGRSYGDKGRFYIFAGGRGGGIGLNVVDHGDSWAGDGMSWDRGGFVGQRSAGVGWRKGDVTTSLGWAHEKNRIRGFFGFPSEKDERVALNLTWRPSPK